MNSDHKQESFSLEALREGDRAEFAHLVEEYSPMIYRLGLKMLNNPQDAEDILQETFIKAYRHISNFDGRSSISTWLYRIATNEALMLLRRKRPDAISFEAPSSKETEPQEPLQIVDWCCLPEQEYLTSEGRARLSEAMERLPTSMRVRFSPERYRRIINSRDRGSAGYQRNGSKNPFITRPVAAARRSFHLLWKGITKEIAYA